MENDTRFALGSSVRGGTIVTSRGFTSTSRLSLSAIVRANTPAAGCLKYTSTLSDMTLGYAISAPFMPTGGRVCAARSSSAEIQRPS